MYIILVYTTELLKFDVYRKTVRSELSKDFMLACLWDMIPSSVCTLRG